MGLDMINKGLRFIYILGWFTCQIARPYPSFRNQMNLNQYCSFNEIFMSITAATLQIVIKEVTAKPLPQR